MVANLELTKTERRLMDVLRDGMPHGKVELLACLPVEDSCSLKMHMVRIREKLVDAGMNIVYVRGDYMLMQRIQRADE